MSTTTPDGPTDMTPDELRFLTYLEQDSKVPVAPAVRPTSSAENLSKRFRNEFHDAFALLQLEVRYGLRLNPEKITDVQEALERYKDDIKKNGDVITRSVQIIMIEMLLRGESLHFQDMSAIIEAAAKDPLLKDSSKELIPFIVGNTIAVFNDRDYLEPAVPLD